MAVAWDLNLIPDGANWYLPGPTLRSDPLNQTRATWHPSSQDKLQTGPACPLCPLTHCGTNTETSRIFPAFRIRNFAPQANMPM